jgi:hypothetical protein
MTGQQFLWASFSWRWDAWRAPDGSVATNRGAAYRYSVGGFFAVFAFILTCIDYWLFIVLPSTKAGTVHQIPAAGSGSFGMGLLFWCLPVWIVFVQEEWQACPGLMAMRKQFFGIRWAREFRDGLFVIRPYDGEGGRRWRLWVTVPGATTLLANTGGSDHWSETELGILAKALGEATGFPLKDEEGTLHHFGSRLTSAGVGTAVAVRHLHTGLVLAQVPGGTMVGANLAKAQLGGADLQGADLREANLHGADLRGASLKGANLTNAQLQGAQLTAADLSGADFTGADLDGTKLTAAISDAGTRWPVGFEAARHGAVLAGDTDRLLGKEGHR